MRLLAAALMALATAAHADLDAELRAIVEDPAAPLASLSVLAVRGGEVAYHAQFGHRRIDGAQPSRSLPADANTLYRVASITKLVVALGVMRLVEGGQADLDRDVGEYLGFTLRNPAHPGVPVTLRMLLSHTSSLRDDAGYAFPEGTQMRDVLANPAAWSRHAPGTYFTYSNLSSGVIGTVIERVTGERFDLAMRRLVLEPLGMSGGFSPAHMPPARVRDIATLYRKGREVGGRMVWDPAGPWVPQVDDYAVQAPLPRASGRYEVGSNGTLFGPAGNLRASAADLGRVMRMLMGDGALDGRRFLSKASVDLLLSRQWSGPGHRDFGPHRDRFHAWGLGNQHFTDVGGAGHGDRLVEGGGFTAVGHHGDAWGLTGILAFDRDSRDGFVFLVGGPGFDPRTTPGSYSSFHRYEERLMTALFRGAVRPAARLRPPAAPGS